MRAFLVFTLLGLAMLCNADEGRVPINHHVEFLQDSRKTSLPEDIIQRNDWQQHTRRTALNQGFTKNAIWLKAPVPLAKMSPGQSWYLVVPYPLLENINIYRVSRPIAGEAPTITPLTEVNSNSQNLAFHLPADWRMNDRVLIHAKSSTSLQVPLEVWSESYFHFRQVIEGMLWGLYFGTLIALLLYNSFVFYSVREAAYGFYALYLTSIIGVMLNISGFSKVYLWPDDLVWNALALPFCAIFSAGCGLLFTRCFLAWEGHRVPLSNALVGMTVVCVIALPFVFIFPESATELASWISTLACLLAITAGAVAWRRGFAIARYFTLAWFFMSLGVLVYLLSVFGLTPVTYWSANSLQAGSALEALLLALALAHRIKLERQQKLEAVQQHHRSERKVREMRLRIMEDSMHERLTGLPNDSLLLTRMRELAGYEPGKPASFYLVIVQYPRLRDVATTLGRDRCQDLFRSISRDLNDRTSLHPDSLCIEAKSQSYIAVTELGNVAFLFNGNLTEEELSQRLKQCLEHYEKTVRLGPVSLVMDAYAGIAHFPRQAGDVEHLYQRALQARDSGYVQNRRQNFYSSEIDQALRRRLALQGALTLAIGQEELELYLQPQLNCESMDLQSAEVLLRWFSPEHGLVPTQELIEIAENAGLMDKLTQCVIRMALTILKELNQQGIHLRLSINLSLQNLMEPTFSNFVIDSARQYGLALNQLILEVTETSMSQEMELVVQNLEALAKAGAHIALDDFGTGYSSLKYLSHLPIHELKIDKSFILKMKSNESDLRIVENTIKLAKALRLETVAEGVEDKASLETIAELGCNRVQGYYTGRPMSLKDFKAWVAQAELEAHKTPVTR